MNRPEHLTIAQLIATPGNNWGGMEKHTADLSEELASRGHSVHILAHPAYRHRFSTAINFHSLPVHLGRRNPLLKLRLRQAIRRLSPDILHAQGNKAAALISAGKKQNCITVGTIHGTKSSHKDFCKLDGTIAVSKGIQQALRHPNTRLIHNGIKPQSNEEKTTNTVPEAGAFALAVGRLESVKQFDNLISAWATLKPPLPLYILGDGSEAGALKAQIQRLGADSFIKLPGHEANPAAWFQQASVCIISSGREGFPYALVEALLAHCPVLSTPVNGARDLLPAESLASSTNLNSLQALLSVQLNDLVGLKESQRIAVERASQELTLTAMVRQSEAFYYDLLSATHLLPKERSVINESPPGNHDQRLKRKNTAVIDLSDQKPFASGSNRHCYRHPDITGRCLKVIRPENIEARYQRQQPFKKLLGKSRLNDNRQEQLAHKQSAIESLIRRGYEGSVWQHLPRFYGEAPTSLGPANESELLLGDHGEPCPTLEQYLQQHGFDTAIQAACKRFCDWLETTSILTRNLLPHNLVIAERDNQPELFLVDGLGAPSIPNTLSAIPAWRKRYVTRRISRFYKRIAWELSDKKQSWEESQRL